MELVNSFPSSDVRSELADIPTLDEIRTVLSLVAGNQAGGINGILPEMVKAYSDELSWLAWDQFT